MGKVTGWTVLGLLGQVIAWMSAVAKSVADLTREKTALETAIKDNTPYVLTVTSQDAKRELLDVVNKTLPLAERAASKLGV